MSKSPDDLRIGQPYIQADGPRARRRSAEDPVKRRRHIKVAYYRLVLNRNPRWIAERFKVSVRTVNYWVVAALGYDDPEAEQLRQHVAAAARDAGPNA